MLAPSCWACWAAPPLFLPRFGRFGVAWRVVWKVLQYKWVCVARQITKVNGAGASAWKTSPHVFDSEAKRDVHDRCNCRNAVVLPGLRSEVGVPCGLVFEELHLARLAAKAGAAPTFSSFEATRSSLTVSPS